ncbi:unnamed protein product [Urochloa humidicola]
MIKIQHYKNNNTPQSYPRVGFSRYKKYTSQKRVSLRSTPPPARATGRRVAPARQRAAGPCLWDAWSPPTRDARPLGRTDPAAGDAAAPSRAGRLHRDTRPAGRAATAAWGVPDFPHGGHR